MFAALGIRAQVVVTREVRACGVAERAAVRNSAIALLAHQHLWPPADDDKRLRSALLREATEVAKIDGQPLRSRTPEAYSHYKWCLGTSTSANVAFGCAN